MAWNILENKLAFSPLADKEERKISRMVMIPGAESGRGLMLVGELGRMGQAIPVWPPPAAVTPPWCARLADYGTVKGVGTGCPPWSVPASHDRRSSQGGSHEPPGLNAAVQRPEPSRAGHLPCRARPQPPT
jgi:hypothetical protein